ncbi:MAG: homoserine O-succinyltransferase [Spirochaetia bacterium]|nr:homoserine O-succinyltransferase [Spirochaetia bacterium]MBQ6673651.1 homoserine O-succinyltransferase [Spirochaetia bacterium]
MPIKIPNGLPAAKTLEKENIFFMTETRAMTQDIRPLQILLLNLMPIKIDTETQFARVLGNTPLQIDLELIAPTGHTSKNTKKEHMLAFYKTFADVKEKYYDGLIITGAPIEHLDFEQVDYWPELCQIMDWSTTHVFSTLHICWGAQAGLYHHFGIPKVEMEKKLSGIYRHHLEGKNFMLFRGFDDTFCVPHSRYTTVLRKDVEKVKSLKILASSPEAGIYAIKTNEGRQIFLLGHAEYDADTLKKEYIRDVEAGIRPAIPENYFPDDDPTKEPIVSWRSCAHLLYANWLNYYVYQSTPYDLKAIPTT